MVTVDMRTSLQDSGLIARKIWQQLFNFYSMGMGGITHMDSLLCDLTIIENHVKRAQLERRPVKFYWEFNRSHTEIAHFAMSDRCYEILYDPSERKFFVTFIGEEN